MCSSDLKNQAAEILTTTRNDKGLTIDIKFMAGYCRCNDTNSAPPPITRAVQEHEYPLLLNSTGIVLCGLVCLFPIYRAKAMYEHQISFQ